ncbi:50S ribosomal protein L37ae [Candidatus Woesearchaeota archaeon]|nr:50S ribosomal protein L37ae [Candidatus Woesearchaeota archaeon]
MASKKGFGSVRRFGPRYGRKIRAKVADVEKVQKARQKCPYCNSLKVKREAAGIFFCSKCLSKFTSKAYFVTKVPALRSLEEIEE